MKAKVFQISLQICMLFQLSTCIPNKAVKCQDTGSMQQATVSQLIFYNIINISVFPVVRNREKVWVPLVDWCRDIKPDWDRIMTNRELLKNAHRKIKCFLKSEIKRVAWVSLFLLFFFNHWAAFTPFTPFSLSLPLISHSPDFSCSVREVSSSLSCQDFKSEMC